MGRKNRSKKQEDPGKGQDFQVNPFAQLGDLVPKESLPKPEPTSPKPKPKPAQESALDREDQELLRAFSGEDLALEFANPKNVKGPLLTLGIQRKGKGGKTVTAARGFADLDLLERMELARDVGRSLGTNARFSEDVLEIQGDQRERAAAYLESRGYRVRIG
jgi:translation initiation factor 1 (eIF-1/SUI1)